MPQLANQDVHRHSAEAMGTVFEIFLFAKTASYARQAAQAAFEEVARIERLFNRFDPSSEMSRLGRLRPGEILQVGIETVECMTVAGRIHSETVGAFDIFHRHIKKIRIPKKPLDLPSKEAPNGLPPGPLAILDRRGTQEGFQVTRRPGVFPEEEGPLSPDLGAIGKGFALDKALEVLREWDIGNALMHAGTSTVLAIGPGPDPASPGRGWPIGIASAWNLAEIPPSVRLWNRSVSGSGTAVKGEHVTDPRSGRPASGHLAAWAAHPSATVADALSTAFLVMTTDEVMSYCAGHPDVWALVIQEEKKCRIGNTHVLT